jgi:hypothetical protein
LLGFGPAIWYGKTIEENIMGNLLSVLLEILGAILTPAQDDVHRPLEVLDTRDPLTRDWNAADRFGIRDF